MWKVKKRETKTKMLNYAFKSEQHEQGDSLHYFSVVLVNKKKRQISSVAANKNRFIRCKRATEAAAVMFICCNILKLQSQLAANPTSYGANIYTCTYGAIRADCLFEFYGAT